MADTSIPHLVLARKWRPERFSELVGQEHVTRTLGEALKRGRIAHAFLFTGIRGVGKTTAARILARCLKISATGRRATASRFTLSTRRISSPIQPSMRC